VIERGELLDLGSDLTLRYRYFSRESLAHPAKLHLGLLAWLLDRYTRPGETIADPMAGMGSTAYAALIQRHVILREIEPKWLAFAHENAAIILREAGLFAGSIAISQADARLPWGFEADHIIFSPPYGNETYSGGVDRFARRLQNLDVSHYSKRWQQFKANLTAGASAHAGFHYGRHPAQIGHFRGDRYWSAMRAIYTQARTALRADGYMILIIKDHVKDRQHVAIADQTATLCESIGFVLAEHHARHVYPLSQWQRRRKERGEPIVEDEDVLVFTTGAKP
jgi:predicted RNA methylase